MPLNFEFKARTSILDELESILNQQQPRFVGVDDQCDTYFNVIHGRLKLREGNIENALIHYTRENLTEAKTSRVTLFQHQPDPSLKLALTKALGIKVVVKKQRHIYFIDNVKFHFDRVDGLGTFIEVEAIDLEGNISLEKLQLQCEKYRKLFRIPTEDLEAGSYSDLLLSLNQ